MARPGLLLVAGAATLLLGLLIAMPARVAYHWFAPDGLALSGLSGTVWNGRATAGAAGGVYFSDLDWRFRPASLFTGKVAWSLSARPPGGSLSTDAAVSLNGNLRLSNVDAALPLALFNSLVPMEGVEGSLALELSRVDIQDGFPAAIQGTMRLSNLVLRPLSPRAIGAYRAVMETNDDGILGTIEDISGILDLTGVARLHQDRSYTFTGQVAATADAPSSVVQQLQYLGSPDEQGRREFRFEGSL